MAKQRIEVSGGGPWVGVLWYPQGATDEARTRATEYNNEIDEEKTVTGTLHTGVAFGDKEIFFVTRPVGGKKGETEKVLMPEHGGLDRDLEKAIEEHGEGIEVEIEYKGKVALKTGRYKGNMAHAYKVFALK